MTRAVTRGLRPSGWSAARVIVIVDFLLVTLALLLDRLGGREIDSALRRAGLDNFVAACLQMWFVASTVAATGFFAWAVHKGRRAGAVSDRISRSLVIDGALLLAWWLVALGACAYAFMLGMAG
ncbi:MAG TPA: hypothetical protein VFQ24_19090 [Terriglobia bacterium]|nr:hypothetical protein [Terriglobia bacterium]